MIILVLAEKKTKKNIWIFDIKIWLKHSFVLFCNLYILLICSSLINLKNQCRLRKKESGPWKHSSLVSSVTSYRPGTDLEKLQGRNPLERQGGSSVPLNHLRTSLLPTDPKIKSHYIKWVQARRTFRFGLIKWVQTWRRKNVQVPWRNHGSTDSFKNLHGASALPPFIRQPSIFPTLPNSILLS